MQGGAAALPSLAGGADRLQIWGMAAAGPSHTKEEKGWANLRGLDGGIIILPESNSDSFPVFTLKEYSVIPIENEDMVFDIRAFYSDQCTEVVNHYLECLSIVSDPDYR